MDCLSCGTSNCDDSRFCIGCGRQLSSTCPDCRRANLAQARFCAHCGAALCISQTLVQTAAATAAGQGSQLGERRQLTLMFCDMIGSTALSTQMDPESLHEIMHVYRKCCAQIIARFEGCVAQYVGDGILAYFSYPNAHEDDAERAVHASLEIIEELGRLNRRTSLHLQVRIGIATGLVVIGGLPNGWIGEAHGATGEALNLAARLQSIAEPNTVVISATTHRLVGGLFNYVDLGSFALKGFADPVQAWRVLPSRSGRNRFEALRSTLLTPLVGRREEIGLLLDRWQFVKAGDGQVVLLVGEAGIGKSRTARVMRESLNCELHARIDWCCSPHHQNRPFYPIIGYIERIGDLSHDDSVDQTLAKVDALLAKHPELAGCLQPLLRSSLPEALARFDQPEAPTPQEQKEAIFNAALAHIAWLASDKPLQILIEDAHWIDPTTLELVELLADRVQTLPAMMIVTARPGFNPSWTSQPHSLFLMLNRLSRQHGADIIDCVTGGKPLPRAVKDRIVDHADGIPLFIEEMTKAVLESNLLRDDGDCFGLNAPLRSLAIPPTLHDSLIARLDRLGDIKAVAQMAATIGREFSQELLAALSAIPDGVLEKALDRLAQAGLVFRRDGDGSANYFFKHALIQNAAYESLLRSTRRTLHASIAEILESRYPATAQASPEILAHHCTQGGLLEKGAGYWLQAGQRACEQSASVEAASQLNEALDLFRQLPDSVEIRQRTLTVLMTLGPVLMTLHGPGSPKVKQVYDEALTLCSGLSYSPLHFTAYWGWWRSAPTFRLQRERADRLSVLAEDLRDPGLRLQVHHCQWATLFNLGNQQACCEHIEKGLEIYRSGDYQAHALLYGSHDPNVCGCAEHALALWLLGYPNRSFIHMSEALAWARHLSHSGSLLHAMDMSLILNFFHRDVQVVHEGARALIEFADKHGFTDHWSKGIIFQGWAVGKLGDTQRGIKEMSDGIAIQQANGTQDDFPLYYDMIAELYGMAGQVERGLDLLDGALEVAEQTGHQYWAVELRRRYGELLLKSADNRDDMAEAYFCKALEIAGQQKVKSLELRTAVSLARLWQGQGLPHEAFHLVAPVYDWFEEGGDTIDMTEARDLLDACGECRSGQGWIPRTAAS